MSNDTLFSKEEEILQRSKDILNEPFAKTHDELVREFSALSKSYKRLLRQAKNLTKVSDRHQHRLYTTSATLDKELGRHVGQEIKEEILKGTGNDGSIRNQYLTILFLDIRGFTNFSEKRSPDDVIRFLKSYYEYTLEIVHRHGGFVKSFMGDGVMLVFGYNQKPHTSNAAINCALEILSNLSEFNEQHNTDITVGIGIHSGPTAAGNIGTAARTEFAVIGNTVNTASRIESQTKKARKPLLFSGAVKDCLQKYPHSPVYVETINLRGKEDKIDLYTFDAFISL